MEIGWEPGQEAGRPLTGDKMISSCSRFPTEIKRSIKDQSLGWSLQKLLFNGGHRVLCSSSKSTSGVEKLYLAPQTFGWDRSCSTFSAAQSCEEPSCAPSSHTAAEREGLAVPQLEKRCYVPRGTYLTTQKTRQQQIKQTQKNKESWQGIFSCDKTRPK